LKTRQVKVNITFGEKKRGWDNLKATLLDCSSFKSYEEPRFCSIDDIVMIRGLQKFGPKDLQNLKLNEVKFAELQNLVYTLGSSSKFGKILKMNPQNAKSNNTGCNVNFNFVYWAMFSRHSKHIL